MNGLWSTTCDDHRKAWVFERRISERPQRVVFLVLDTSDSMTRHRSAMRDVLVAIGDRLDIEDRCVVWAAGSTQKPEEIQILSWSHRARIAQVLDNTPETDGGTWMSETVEAVAAEARRYADQPGIFPFRIIISDGEVFDAEAVPRSTFRLFQIGSRDHDRLSERTDPISIEGLTTFLACPTLRADLSWTPTDAQAWWASANWEIEEPALGPPVKPRDSMFRLVFAGEVRPSLQIEYAAGDAVWSESVGDRGSIDPGTLGGLKLPRSGEPFTLDDQKLNVLVALARHGYRSEGNDLKCSHGSNEYEYDANQRLECSRCHASLISKGMRCVPAGYALLREIEVLQDGRFGENTETNRTPRRGRFELQTDEGREFLVLNLRP